MKVILTSNIKKLGKVGDLINVKNGFARNFLFPQKKALRNTKNHKEIKHCIVIRVFFCRTMTNLVLLPDKDREAIRHFTT